MYLGVYLYVFWYQFFNYVIYKNYCVGGAEFRKTLVFWFLFDRSVLAVCLIVSLVLSVLLLVLIFNFYIHLRYEGRIWSIYDVYLNLSIIFKDAEWPACMSSLHTQMHLWMYVCVFMRIYGYISLVHICKHFTYP